ncbi:YybH family protein [Qipengyuania sphaerica]|uniref:YybH family protein n=1 Tax=Qipengyuania sphaerica TaxID=2867243 RepID=UPI001C87DBAF|nr:DUF4440 domain-containing protein [Qipengyuania sphaerica]MBX7539731.1 hypothetical protein [Qipengyuania sphaerica]
MRALSLTAAVVFAMSAGPVLAGPSPESSPSAGTEAAFANSAEDVMTLWLRARERGDAEAMTGFYEKDGKHSTARTFAGHAEILPMFEHSLATVDSLILLDRHLVTQGDYAFETGVVRQQGVIEGQRLQLDAEYVAVLASQEDGTWLIRHLIGGNVKMGPVASD